MEFQEMPKPDPRAVALRVLAAYLKEAGAKPLEDKGAMPAPPRTPAGGVAFSRGARPPFAPPHPGTPPTVPFPALPHAASPSHGRPSAMDVIARFVEASRARGGRP